MKQEGEPVAECGSCPDTSATGVVILSHVEAAMKPVALAAFEAGVPVVAPEEPGVRTVVGMGGHRVPAGEGWSGLFAAAEHLTRDVGAREAVIRKGYAQARRLLPDEYATDETPIGEAGWFSAVGAWGDVFAACGNALSLLARSGRQQCGCVYYGWDPALVDFLEAQPWVSEVRYLIPESATAYREQIHALCDTRGPGNEVVAALLNRAGLTSPEVWPTHVTAELKSRPVVRRWYRAHLPSSAHQYAAAVVNRLPSRWYLLHPVSLQSNAEDQHWPHWITAIRWLLKETPWCYVLTGIDWDASGLPESPRLVNLVGKTATHQEVLALAERANGLISTSNSLAMWSLMQNVPAVVCCNVLSRNPEGYFYRWIEAPRNQLLPCDAGLPEFSAAVRALLRGWS